MVDILLFLYRVVAYVMYWGGGGGQQVHIYFHQKTKDAHTLTLDESILDVSKVSQHTYMF